MNSPQTIGINTVLGGFKIEKELGKGGMGVVYKAHELSLNRKVALKVLSQALSSDEEFITRFRKEAQIVAALNHPNIVGVLAFGHELGHYYFAMEYIQGTDLGKILKAKTVIPVDEALSITRQIAEALSEVGPRGVVHRDLKPSNIMIDKMNRVRVTDFGVAHIEGATDGLTKTGMFLGTPEYASPEQATGKRVDMRSDIYAMGALLYRMLSGKPPIIGDSPLAVVAKIATEPVTPIGLVNSSVPKPVCDLIEKMMAKKAGDRFQTPADAVAAIDACIEAVKMDDGAPGDATVSKMAMPPAPPPPPQKGNASSRMWAAIAIVLAVALIGLYFAKGGIFSPKPDTDTTSVARTIEGGEAKDLQGKTDANIQSVPAAPVQKSQTADAEFESKPKTETQSATRSPTEAEAVSQPLVQDSVPPVAVKEEQSVHVASHSQPSPQPPAIVLPDKPTVLLVVTGVEEMATELRTYLESTILDSGLEILSPAEIPVLREKMQFGATPISWYDIKQFVPAGQAQILVLAKIHKAGSTMLTFYGQTQEQITASYSVRSLDMSTGKAVDRSTTGVVRYTALNMQDEFADAVPDAVKDLGSAIHTYWQKKIAAEK